jgi:hypothetical protein
VENAREVALGPRGTVFVGSMRAGAGRRRGVGRPVVRPERTAYTPARTTRTEYNAWSRGLKIPVSGVRFPPLAIVAL